MITAAIVAAIAVSALVTDPVRRGVSLCVPGGNGVAPEVRYETLRQRVARAMGKSIRLHVRPGAPGDDCDLVVLSVHEWRALPPGEALEPVAEVEGARGAVVIAGAEGPRELDRLTAGTMLFTAPHSLNGCWIQLAMLRRKGIPTPDRIEALRFAPAPGRAERVVFEVALGRAPAGAVPVDVLDGMLADGRLMEGEVQVIEVSPGAPEVLLCQRSGSGTAGDGLVREGLRPVTHADLERVEELFRMAASMGWE